MDGTAVASSRIQLPTQLDTFKGSESLFLEKLASETPSVKVPRPGKGSLWERDWGR
jgi:hypothetical protein